MSRTEHGGHEPSADVGHHHGDHGHHHAQSHGVPESKRLSPAVAGAELTNRALFVDAFSGLAGDMWVGALLDIGVPLDSIQEGLSALRLPGYQCEVTRVHKHGIAATRFAVLVDSPQPQRSYGEIRQLLDRAQLNPSAKALAQKAFAILAQAESEVHGVAVSDVHFHEVGAVDSIVDIVAAAIGLTYLKATVSSAAIPVSRGFVNTQHGPMPLPAPATLLCLRGIPTEPSGLSRELVTPTGACLLKATAVAFMPWPEMEVERVGYGAGSRDLTDRPNLLRLVLGSSNALERKGQPQRARQHFEPTDAPLGPRGDEDEPSSLSPALEEQLTVLSANVDDMTPEWVAHALLCAQQAGAVDTWSTPISMKKGRPGFALNAMVRPAEQEAVIAALLKESTSLGLRMSRMRRRVRPRHIVELDTPYGVIAIKVAQGDGHGTNVAPEFESCKKAASNHRVPLKDVYAAALAAYLQQHPDSRFPSGDRAD